MATKRAKVNKTLEKAKKLVSKKGKNKTKKGTWPEGQARPQSKAYDIENDKTVPAKRTGYRFTKEGAKKLGKQPNDKPTADEIEKYRNQTFKVKGKVNKSGPKGVGDGSFRYLYIESRADKSDLNKARKLELGGYNPDEMLELKIFVDVYEDDYEQGEGKNVNSYEVNWLKDPQVLAKDLVKYLSEELYLSENPNDYAIDDDGNIHTDQLQDDDGIHVNDKATLERWKKGEEKLYNAHYYIRPLAVKNRRPSVDELSKATGIGTYAKGGKIKVRYVEENEVHDWTLEDVLDVINRDRSENWTDYDKSDWQEGWDNWVEGEFYSLKDENGKPLNKFEDGGEMEKGGVVFDPKEVREFQEHIFYYYGKNGALVSELEEGVPATTGEVLKAVSQYLAFINKVNQNFNGFHGSMHRHVVHDIIEYNRNPKTNNYYYKRVIDDMKKTPILEYGGILQPMIGGVNADPRFDIYNTTMFAEKGAELPKKKPKFEEGIKSAVKNYFHSKEIDDPTFWKDRDGEYNIEEMVEMAKDKFNSSEYALERYAQEYADSKYAKGGSTKKGEKIKVRNLEDDSIEKWSIEELLDRINEDNATDDFNYTIEDWKEGFDDTLSEFYSLNDKNGKPLNDFYAKGGEITMATLKKREIKKINQLIEEYAHKGESIEFYQPFSINVNDSDYLAWAVMENAIAVTDNEGYDGGMPLSKLTYFQLQKVTSQIMDNIGEMAKGGRTKKGWSIAEDYSGVGGTKNPSYYLYNQDTGETKGRSARLTKKEATEKMKKLGYMAHGGSTHEQGYDDREDERLAMRHGKIASKDFVGSHKRREHSRRDDARFETRNK